MRVTDAVQSRRSIRAFLSKPVKNSLIRQLLQKSSRSASGGNLQPWKIYIINKNSMKDFLKSQQEWSKEEAPSYEIYPRNLKEPYRTSRYELGEQMYKILNISKAKYLSGEESLSFIAVLGEGRELKLNSGKRHFTIKGKDLQNFIGQRGRRGNMLPKGFRNIDSIEVILLKQETLKEAKNDD